MVTYSADFQERRLRNVLGAMVRGMAQSRYMAYRLARKDIRVEYSRSAFGILWDFLDPFILGIIFYFLAKVRVINPGDLGMPYALFVIYGLLIFQSFADAMVLGVDSIHRARDLLAYQKLPPESIILSVFYRVLFNSGIRAVILLIFSLLMMETASAAGVRAFSAGGFVLFLIAFPLIIFCGLSIGVFLAPFNSIYRDTGRAVRLMLNPLRYLTPVLFLFSGAWTGMVMKFNPIAGMVYDLRQLAVAGHVSYLPIDAAWFSVFVLVFLTGWYMFHLAMPAIAERG